MGRERHHHRSRRKKWVIRIVLAVGMVMFVGGLAEFIYYAHLYAHLQAECSQTTSDILTSGEWSRPYPLDCMESGPGILQYLQLGGIVTVLGLAILIAAWVTLSRASRRAKRIVIVLEAVVLVLTIAYSLLWTFAAYEP